MIHNQYVKDCNDKDLILDSYGFQVMMEWEKPYMEALVDNMNPSGDVLEIGFGFGYSASQFMKYNIDSYTIIECDDNGLKKAEQWAKFQTCNVNIIKGMWQTEILRLNNQYDCVFLDDSPIRNGEEVNKDLFFLQMITKLAKKGCRVSFYAHNPPWFNVHPATRYSCKTININIPDNCLYVNEKMKRNNIMFLPLLEYPMGTLTQTEMEIYAKN